MKRIVIGFLCSSLLMSALSGCGQGKQSEAKGFLDSQVVSSQANQVQGVEDKQIFEEKKNIEEKVATGVQETGEKDLTMTSIQGKEGQIDYSTVKGLNLPKASHIAVVVKSTKTSYWTQVQKGMNAAIADLNAELGYKGEDKVRITFEGPSQDGDVETQINIIDAVLSENPAVLCLAAIDMDSCEAQLETASENGIPVIALDSMLKSDIVTTVCATDNYQAGVEAAKHLSAAIGEEGRVAVMAHTNMTTTSIERVKGFQDEITNNHPKISIVQVSYENKEQTVAQMAKVVLDTNLDLSAYYATNEKVAKEILHTVKEYTDRHIMVVGFDAGKEQINAIKEGTQVGTIVQNPYGMGYATIAAAARAQLELSNDTYVNSGYQWLDQSNVGNELYSSYLYE